MPAQLKKLVKSILKLLKLFIPFSCGSELIPHALLRIELSDMLSLAPLLCGSKL